MPLQADWFGMGVYSWNGWGSPNGRAGRSGEGRQRGRGISGSGVVFEGFKSGRRRHVKRLRGQSRFPDAAAWRPYLRSSLNPLAQLAALEAAKLDLVEKLQNPKPKTQVNPNVKRIGVRPLSFEHWKFKFTWDLEPGIWDFRLRELSVRPTRPARGSRGSSRWSSGFLPGIPPSVPSRELCAPG